MALKPRTRSSIEALVLLAALIGLFGALGWKMGGGNMLKTLMISRQSVFPVLDVTGRLIGMVSERHLRPYILDTRLYDQLIVDDFMGPLPPLLPDTATVGDAARVFDQSNAEVIAVTHNGRFQGILSKAHLLENYRRLLGYHELF